MSAGCDDDGAVHSSKDLQAAPVLFMVEILAEKIRKQLR